MKPAEIRAVEDLVNAQIRRNLPIETNIMDLEAAKAKGAMALFGEKYDDHVRVLSMGISLPNCVVVLMPAVRVISVCSVLCPSQALRRAFVVSKL